jgi:hypothetical protein
MQPDYQQPAQHPAPDYNFILDPQQPEKPKLFNFNANSMPLRILLVVGILFVLMIVFAVVKSAIGGGGGSTAAVLSVAQDQQELIHLATNAEDSVTTDLGKNFTATALLSLQSEQTELISYLKSNHQKVSPKQLNLKISKSTDEQLAAAKSASTFDDTYVSVMRDKLEAYMADLQKAYSQTKGSKGRALLNEDYQAAQLLQKQLES